MSTRLATLLINLGERFGEGGTNTTIGVNLTHQDLAIKFASTREAVSKAMSEFQRDGIIETRKRKIFIRGREALSEPASGPSGLSAEGQIRI